MDLLNFFDLSFLDSDLFTWVIVPLLIFTARVTDVSMMTMRIIFCFQGPTVPGPGDWIF